MSKFIVSKNLKYEDIEDAFAETEAGDSLLLEALWGGNVTVYKKDDKGIWVKEHGNRILPEMYDQDSLVSAIYEDMTGPNAYRSVKLNRKSSTGYYYTSLMINRG